MTKNEPQLAAIAFDRSATLTPTSRDAQYFLGLALLASLNGQPTAETNNQITLERAKTALRTASDLDPLDSRSNILLAQIKQIPDIN